MTANLDLHHLTGIGLALGLGLLVGIQRGWSLRNLAEGTRFAGIRTFGLLGLAGGIAGTLYGTAQGPALIMLAAAAALIVIGYRRMSNNDSQISGTASMVGLITLASGFVAATGEYLLGTIIVVAMVMLLSMRSSLHRWVSHLSEKEMLAIARFAVIALVILPILPDRGLGPYDAWNPRQLWLVVVMVSGFSFAGYFATKLLGPKRGVIAAACAGAMVSSTAVTAALAARMKQGQGDPRIQAAAISAASVVMFLRVLLLVALLAPFALGKLALLVAPAVLVSLAFAAWYLRMARPGSANGEDEEGAEPHQANLRNPFDLGPALLLTGMVMVFTLIARYVLAYYGDQELAIVLAISGTVDVDSAIITMGSLPPGAIAADIAAVVLAVPAVLNTLFKSSIAVSLGGWKQGKHGAIPLIASAATIILTWVVLR
jgi:uncharacterized membrane protein (DUF4010 family)